jgi:3-methyladenine DNA glycosylase AlkD
MHHYWSVNEAKEIIEEIKANGTEVNRAGMARFGINVNSAYGVPITYLREMAKRIGKDHGLALDLWDSEVHEARILASIVDEPNQVTLHQMERWVIDFDSWDICDQCCNNLFGRTKFAREVIGPWCDREEEFVRRAGFVMIAVLSVKEKKAACDSFQPYLSMIERHSQDKRNNVKKAVNWALRQIGKRDLECHALAFPVALRLSQSKEATARWIGKDAVRELSSEKILARVHQRSSIKGK